MSRSAFSNAWPRALAALGLAAMISTGAQSAGGQAAPMQSKANPADVSSIDALIKATYDVISGPAGQKRDWDRFRSLFVPGARLIPTGLRPDSLGGGFGLRVLTPEEYVQTSGPFLENNGFFEVESGRKMEQFGQIAHLFSTYESRHKAEDAQPFMRGINSFQVFNDGKRWWIVTIYWAGERKDLPIPEKYLK